MTDPDSGIFSYSYDAKGRLTSLENPQNETTSISYDKIDQITRKEMGNGTFTDQTFDAAGQLTVVSNTQSDSTVINRFSYTYDCVGNRQTVAEASGAQSTWTYDNTYQLTREERNGAHAFDVSYTYDAVGNRLQQLDSGVSTTYTYDAANELLQEYSAGALTSYAYDECGNRTLKDAPAATTFYSWNEDNKLTTAEPPSGAVTMSYNADGKRVEKDATQTTKFIYDFNKLLAETDGSNATQMLYTSTDDEYGDLVSEFDGANSSYHQYDALGSTDSLTNDSEAATDRYTYRAFGLEESHTGSSSSPFAFVGQQGYHHDPETELYLLDARFVDAHVGRFVNEDPSGYAAGDENLYRYATNNPINVIDPSGHAPPDSSHQMGGVDCANQPKPKPSDYWVLKEPLPKECLILVPIATAQKEGVNDGRCDPGLPDSLQLRQVANRLRFLLSENKGISAKSRKHIRRLIDLLESAARGVFYGNPLNPKTGAPDRSTAFHHWLDKERSLHGRILKKRLPPNVLKSIVAYAEIRRQIAKFFYMNHSSVEIVPHRLSIGKWTPPPSPLEQLRMRRPDASYLELVLGLIFLPGDVNPNKFNAWACLDALGGMAGGPRGMPFGPKAPRVARPFAPRVVAKAPLWPGSTTGGIAAKGRIKWKVEDPGFFDTSRIVGSAPQGLCQVGNRCASTAAVIALKKLGIEVTLSLSKKLNAKLMQEGHYIKEVAALLREAGANARVITKYGKRGTKVVTDLEKALKTRDVIAYLRCKGGGIHAITIERIDKGWVYFIEPNNGTLSKMTVEAFRKHTVREFVYITR